MLKFFCNHSIFLKIYNFFYKYFFSFLFYLIINLFILFLNNDLYSLNFKFNFNNNLDEQRFINLTKKLKCIFCKNQNLYDSYVPFANNLKAKICLFINNDICDEDIIFFMVRKYGENILYEPLFKTNTLILWIAPMFIFIFGILLFFYFLIISKK